MEFLLLSELKFLLTLPIIFILVFLLLVRSFDQ